MQIKESSVVGVWIFSGTTHYLLLTEKKNFQGDHTIIFQNGVNVVFNNIFLWNKKNQIIINSCL